MSAEAVGIDLTFAAMADPSRRRAIELLGDGPRRAGELAAALDVTPSVMSRHLRVLRQSGLVEETSPDYDARVRIYSLRSGPMSELKRWLREVEESWSEQLAALKRHVEQAP